jgi:hypothetical protein
MRVERTMMHQLLCVEKNCIVICNSAEKHSEVLVRGWKKSGRLSVGLHRSEANASKLRGKTKKLGPGTGFARRLYPPDWTGDTLVVR